MATATINTYQIGDLVRCDGRFQDAAGTDIDPDVVRFKFRPSGGSTTTYEYPTDPEVVRDSVGNYHVDVPVTLSGNWYYRFEGETSGGVAQGAAETHFKVEPSNV